mgnify:CR=1 FL=1
MRLTAAVFLVVSALVFIRPDPVEAWSSDDRAVAVFGNGGVSTNPHGYSVVVDSSGNIYTTGRFGSPSAGNETVDFDEEVTSQALSKVETEESNDDDGSFPTVGLIGTLAGLAAVAGLGLTSAGQLMWKRITGFLAGSILGFLILGRKRNRCEHCNKQLSSKDGVLVDEDDNYECDDNPEGDHHQLKEK